MEGKGATKPINWFVRSLVEMLSDARNSDIITWEPSGASFALHDIPRLCSEVLPRYFRHSNFSSFSRSLCFYSFKKITGDGYASVKGHLEYRHPYFIRGASDDVLAKVVRRTNVTGLKQLSAQEVRKRDRTQLLLERIEGALKGVGPSDSGDAEPSGPAGRQGCGGGS